MSGPKRALSDDGAGDAKRPRLSAPTRVVKLRRSKGAVVQGCDVYIGRACSMGGWQLSQSKWANPFTISACGSAREAVAKYRDYILQRPSLLADVKELRGKILGCWCKPGPCHGDVLKELADAV